MTLREIVLLARSMLGKKSAAILRRFSQKIGFDISCKLRLRGGSNKYPQSMFWAEIWKISEVFIGKFSVFGDEIFNIFE